MSPINPHMSGWFVGGTYFMKGVHKILITLKRKGLKPQRMTIFDESDDHAF